MQKWFQRIFKSSPEYPFHLKGRKDVVFVHITKTAGTSIRRSLKFNKPSLRKTYRKHYYSKELIRLIGKEEWEKSFTFTIIRNPWDRWFSYYRYEKRKLLDEGQVIKIFDQDDFRLWTFQRLRDGYNELEDLKKRNYSSQIDWLLNEDDQIDIDFIGRFENIEKDFEEICRKINFTANLVHKNKSLPVLNYREFYDQELIDFVADFYKKDIEYFNYSF